MEKLTSVPLIPGGPWGHTTSQVGAVVSSGGLGVGFGF